MRWSFAGFSDLPIEFSYFRHAHSHLGYYALLFPLAWLGWKAVDAPIPSLKILTVYFIATATAFVGFLQSGYGILAISGSTVIAIIWLGSGWSLKKYLRSKAHPLALIFPGIIFSEACIPPIAIYLRQDPALAQSFVVTFLSALLFMVIIPSALATMKYNFVRWPILFIASCSAALYFGVWPNLLTQIGTGFFALLLLGGVVTLSETRLHLKVIWTMQALGMLLLALNILPNNHFTGVGAIHFAILGPVLATLTQHWFKNAISDRLWYLNYGFCALMSAALLAQGIGMQGTMLWAAIGGTGTLLWWTAILLRYTVKNRNFSI